MTSRRGFLLMEMVGVLVLMAVGMILATQIFRMSMTAERSARLGITQAGHIDDALRHLRADVWNASTLQATPDTLTLTIAGSPVTWRITPDPLPPNAAPHTPLTVHLERSPADHPAYAALPPFAFAAGGPAVTLAFPVDATAPSATRPSASQPASGKTQQVTLVSQLMLAGGGR